MSYFVNTVAAYLAGQTVNATFLVEFDFSGQTIRIWPGCGDLYAGAQTWKGIGNLGSISGIESAIGDAAPQVTFTLSGVDPRLVGEAVADSTQVKNRNVTVYLQFFDGGNQPLDAPYAIYIGVMDVMKIKATGPQTRTIELTSETLFTRRGMPPFGWLSNTSQQGLYPGDNGLSWMTQMEWITTGWPWL